MRKKNLLVLVITALFIVSCGQRGPLYLPEQPEQNQPTADEQQSPENQKPAEPADDAAKS